MAKQRKHNPQNTSTIEPIMQLWLLRIIVPLNGHHTFVSPSHLRFPEIAEALGLGYWFNPTRYQRPVFFKHRREENSNNEFDQQKVLTDLRALHQYVEKQYCNAKPPTLLRQNIQHLTQLFGLDGTDCRILEFVISLHNDHMLWQAACWLEELSATKLFHTLSVILALPETDIRKALNADSILTRSGLLSVDRRKSARLPIKLNLLSDRFADLMTNSKADPINLFRGTISSVSKSQLDLNDYSHIQSSLDILLPYLRHATTTQRRGVNILLHGAPGTGKSEFAKVLAQQLGRELFQVANEDEHGDPVDGERRLRAFRVAQSFFSHRSALFVFDEIEDVFNDGDRFFGRKSTAQLRKAWINRMLEENPVPTLWLSNSINGIDSAFIRRFDMVFELPIPATKQRKKILQNYCGDLLDPEHISRIADVETLAPAVLAKASSVIRSIQHDLGQHTVASAFDQLISNTLEAQGHRVLLQHDPNRLPDTYDPGFIHADANLVTITQGITHAGSARLCLYGPPGTGKTAYGRWLAEQLGTPLLVKKASDLMSKWVGECEKNIASTFRQAELDGALLLIDEVDSFLQDRRGAQQRWQVTQVNEMLTQMESFGGVFIASTNLMEGLDQAALRRFDLKVKFDFLQADQAWLLLKRHCTSLQLPEPQPEEMTRIMRLKNLTPGDFAAVARQHRFRPLETASAFIAALEAECFIKGAPKSPIGFI